MHFSRIMFLVLGVFFLMISVISLSNLAKSYGEDYWWTHKDMKLPYLQASSGRFEVYIKDRLLEKAAAHETILLQNNGSVTPLRVKDLTVRLNNIQQMTQKDVIFGVSFGTAGLVFLLLYLACFIPRGACCMKR